MKIDILKHKSNNIYRAFKIGERRLTYNTTLDFCYETLPGSRLMFEYDYSSSTNYTEEEIEKMSSDELKEVIKLSFPELFL